MATKRTSGSKKSEGDNDGPNNGNNGDGELRGSKKMGTAVISGTTFANKSVVYY